MAVYSALPTLRIGGQEYPEVTQLMQSLDMTEREGGMSSLELRVINWASDDQGNADYAFEAGDVLKLGAQIAIYGGDENAPQEIFRGLVTGLEGEYPEGEPPSLVVLAEDAFQSARMARRTKVWDDLKISNLASNLANQLSLRPVVTAFTENIGTWVQLNESDLAFLRRILARYDGDLQVVGGELHVSPRKDVQRGTINLELHSQLRRARVMADLAHQVTEVTASGWDYKDGRRVKSTSTGANAGSGSGTSGANILRDAIGSRSQHVGQPAVLTDDEVQALADAMFDKAARSFVRVEAVASGNPAIRVGTNVALSGMGGRFDNTYYVTHACHRFGLSRGYETEFEAECAYLGNR